MEYMCEEYCSKLKETNATHKSLSKHISGLKEIFMKDILIDNREI